jgi:predicted MFS family arabinose efflux permease
LHSPDHNDQAATTRRRFFGLFPSIVLPMGMAVMDQTIVSTALPDIAATLGHVEWISWVIVAYLISSTVAAPVYGQLGDRYGRRNLMFVCLGVFMVAALMCAFAPNMLVLGCGRALQGLGGGGLMALSQALVGEVVAPRERGRFQGFLSAVILLGTGFGPIVGGLLTQHFGWRAIFFTTASLAFLATLLTLRLTAHPGTRISTRFDAGGVVLFAIFVAASLLTLRQVQRVALDALPLIVALAVVAVAALVLLLRQERRASAPLLPLDLMRQPSIWRCNLMVVMHGASMVSLVAFLPLYLYVTRGASPGETGLILVPLMAGLGVGSMLTGLLVSNTNLTAIFPSIGLTIVAFGMLALAFYSPVLTSAGLAWSLALISPFLGTVMTIATIIVQAAAPRGSLGAATATVLLSRAVGSAFGTALFATVLFAVLALGSGEAGELFRALVERGPVALESVEMARRGELTGEIAQAFRAAFGLVACFAAVGAVLAWTVPDRRI